MKKQQRDAFRVHHMVQACEKIAKFITDKKFNDLLISDLLASRVERQLEIIGEAASHVSEETYAEWPLINWKGMKNARNFIAHEYFRADYAKIWDTIEHVIPIELVGLRDILRELETRFGSPDDENV